MGEARGFGNDSRFCLSKEHGGGLLFGSGEKGREDRGQKKETKNDEKVSVPVRRFDVCWWCGCAIQGEWYSIKRGSKNSRRRREMYASFKDRRRRRGKTGERESQGDV